MILQLLNGDLLSYEDISYPRRLYNHKSYLRKLAPRLRTRISDDLHVSPEFIRLVPRPRDNYDTDFHIDAYVLILPTGVLELRVDDSVLNQLSYRDIIRCQNASLRQQLQRRRHSLSAHCRNALKLGPFEKSYSQLANPDDQFVETHIMPNIDTLKNVIGLQLNQNDRVVDWYFENPQHISRPQFLGNSNPRAVSACIQWLDKEYANLEEMFNFNPDVLQLYIRYLEMNESADMFWYIWKKCPYLKPHEPIEILKRLLNVSDISIEFLR